MKITSKKMERGKRGPLKGDGGRPKDKLYNDPDRWIIVGALWYKKNPREQRSFAVLQALDNLSTQYDCIELARGTKVKDGIEYGALAIVNTADAYGFKGNRADRQSLSAPGGIRLRVSRLKNLQAKVAWYQRARLSKGEELWLSLCHLALVYRAWKPGYGVAHTRPDRFGTPGGSAPETRRNIEREMTFGCRYWILQPNLLSGRRGSVSH